MTYNNNIILNIIQSEFWDEIEIYVASYVLELDDWNSNDTFDNFVDYAELDSIDEIVVDNYDVMEMYGKTGEYISGTIEIQASVDGYAHWECEDIVVDSGEIRIGVPFSFYAENDTYYDFGLKHIY